MTMGERIREETKQALKAGEALTVSVLRMLLAAIHNREIEKRPRSGTGALLSDEEIIQTIRAELKKRIDAAEAYRDGGRAEASAREQSEGEILKTFLPPEMADEELVALVRSGIARAGATSAKDAGKVMGLVMRELAGRASGEKVRAIVERELGSL